LFCIYLHFAAWNCALCNCYLDEINLGGIEQFSDAWCYWKQAACHPMNLPVYHLQISVGQLSDFLNSLQFLFLKNFGNRRTPEKIKEPIVLVFENFQN
jgi:hypothetical protein